MIHIKIPATTANMGPGFDCIGMAFSLYNNLWVDEISGNEALVIENKNPDLPIPLNENNLIYRSMRRFYEETGIAEMPKVRLIQEDNIPLTRGLGSSAACVVGGILAANEISGAKLSKDDLCYLAAKIEGHPDNSTPAITGGIVVGALSDSKLDYIKIIPHENIKFAVMIPGFRLETKKARGVLPKNISIADAVYNISRASLLTAAFMSGSFDLLSTAMDDRLHQPYRLPLVPDMDRIFDSAKANGAKGVFLSGAGPSIIAVYENGQEHFISNMNKFLSTLSRKWKIQTLAPDNDGAKIDYPNQE